MGYNYSMAKNKPNVRDKLAKLAPEKPKEWVWFSILGPLTVVVIVAAFGWVVTQDEEPSLVSKTTPPESVEQQLRKGQESTEAQTNASDETEKKSVRTPKYVDPAGSLEDTEVLLADEYIKVSEDISEDAFPLREKSAGEILIALEQLNSWERAERIEQLYVGRNIGPEGWRGIVRGLPKKQGSSWGLAVRGIGSDAHLWVLSKDADAQSLRDGDEVRVYGQLSNISVLEIQVDSARIVFLN